MASLALDPRLQTGHFMAGPQPYIKVVYTKSFKGQTVKKYLFMQVETTNSTFVYVILLVRGVLDVTVVRN